MPYRITYVVDTSDASNGYVLSAVNVLVAALAKIDALFLKSHSKVPPLYQAGVRYLPEPPGQEEWQDIPTSLKLGALDDEDAAGWRAAELRVRHGIQATPFFDGRHMLVKYTASDGSLKVENPALILSGGKITGERRRSFHRVTFALDLFSGPGDRTLSRDTLNVMLVTLTKICILYLKLNPDTPPIYRSGVRYMEEPPGQEDWQDPGVSIQMGILDCEDAACWRAAELILQGVRAEPFFKETRRKDGGYLFHILDKLPGGRVEDPSRILGMR